MNYFRKTSGGMWAVQCDRHGLRPGDGIDVQTTDGRVVRKVVRKVISARNPEGDLVIPCRDGTPEVRRPLEEKTKA